MPRTINVIIGDTLAADLDDFCTAHYNCPRSRVVEEAVRALIDDRLAKNSEAKKRFDKARMKRLGIERPGANVFKLKR